VPDLCFRCHEPSRAWLSEPVVHAPLRSRPSCLSCHGAHAAAASPLLARAGERLCFGCHDSKPFRRKNVHAALQQGCATCHDPHAAKGRNLLREDVNTLCKQCHEDTSKHFHKVSGVTDPRNNEPLTCVGCHSPHSSDHQALLLRDPARDLCIQCHDPSSGPRRR